MSKKNKIGRNSPCHCGSGKKYKKCCMNEDNSKKSSVNASERIDISDLPKMSKEQMDDFVNNEVNVEKCYVEVLQKLPIGQRLPNFRTDAQTAKIRSDLQDAEFFENQTFMKFSNMDGEELEGGKVEQFNQWFHTSINHYSRVLKEDEQTAEGKSEGEINASTFASILTGGMNQEDHHHFRFGSQAVISKEELKELAKFDVSYFDNSIVKSRTVMGEEMNAQTYSSRVDKLWSDSIKMGIPNFWLSETWSNTLVLPMRRMFMPFNSTQCVSWLVTFGECETYPDFTHNAHPFTKWNILEMEEYQEIENKFRTFLSENKNASKLELLTMTKATAIEIGNFENDYHNFQNRKSA